GRLLGGSGIGHVLSTILRRCSLGCGRARARRPFKCVIEVLYFPACSFSGCFLSVFFGMPWSEAKMAPQRRCSKNSGGGIAPAAIGGLIEGASCTVNAFQPARMSGKGAGNGA